MFELVDFKKEGFINYQGLVNYMMEIYTDREKDFFKYIEKLGFRKNLRHELDIPNLADINTDSPIYILSHDEQFF